jgi:hypothetical protein
MALVVVQLRLLSEHIPIVRALEALPDVILPSSLVISQGMGAD